jgi:two-component system, NtrC family, nitrogen regulation sensor histidine kinase NtrY
MPKASRRLTHDQQIMLYALLAGAPAVVVSMCFLWLGDTSPKVQWTLTLLVIGFWLGFSASVRHRLVRPLQTMANLLSALREGDFSIRARGASHNEPLGDVYAEINSLGNLLQAQRLGALEATTLLRTVMEEIDVAIFAFDSNETLRLVNRTGQELLAAPAERVLGRSAKELGLKEFLEGDDTRVLANIKFPGGTGRWGLRRTSFREGGRPHSLLVIADLSVPLREEELKAWQRLVRVLGHELNNSLAPIKSIAGSLTAILKRGQRAPDWEDDMRSGLEIIEARADGLSRFMQAYARLAKLPAPSLALTDVASIVRRAAALETRRSIAVTGGPGLTASLDAAQIEQVLINLFRNAVEAVLETDGGVRVSWLLQGTSFEVRIEDDGPGLANTANLFVPFFTTKPSGSGIGLLLCRQIAENHGGSLSLRNREGGASGCLATLRLPI